MANYPPTPSFGLNFTAPAVTAPGSAYNPTISTTYPQPQTRQVPARSIISDQVDSYTAFQQNRNVPAFSAAAVASGIPPLPIFPNWGVSASWRPGPSSSHTPIMSGYGSNGSNGPFVQSSQDPLRSGYMTAGSNMSVVPQHDSPNNTLRVQETEEGELSEGDLGNNTQSTSAYVHGDRPYDNQSYDPSSRDDEYEPAPAIPDDDDDDAYSPVASPMPLEEYPSSNKLKGRPTTLGWQDNEYSRNALQNSSYSSSNNFPSRVVDENRIDTQVSSLVANKSHAEVFKLAENAVLNLMPAKVSFQDYLDEGVSEDLVKRIFENLRLPQAPAKINDAATTSTQESAHGVKINASDTVISGATPITKGSEKLGSASDNTAAVRKDTPSTSTAPPKPLSMASDKATKAEERKDKIARLMAAKANKQPAVLSAQTAPPQSASPAGPAVSTQPSTKIDKQQLLRQKMEALQKSREARAAKMAQNPEPAPQPAFPSVPPTAPQPTASNIATASPSPVHQLTPTQMPVRTSSEPRSQNSTSIVPSIPGLFLASTASPRQSPNSMSTTIDPFQSATQRKRPVASDFDEPTPSVATFKRPFGHSRHDQKLVIDVSDEDDDEESDMDIDEPSDDSSAPPIVQQGNTSMKNIRDQPPLTDVPSRKAVTKAAPSMTSPSTPQGTSNSSASDRIKLHEQAILQMRKKIEEAEARKKAKQAQSGTQTPHSIESSASSDKTADTSIAQKVADSVRIEQLMDDVSRKVDVEKQKLADEQRKATELLLMEAERKKVIQGNIKSKRLAELQSEIAKHDAAIQRGIEEKRRLAEEMEKLSHDADEQLQADSDRLRLLEAGESDRIHTPAQTSSDPTSVGSPVAITTGSEHDTAAIEPPASHSNEEASITLRNNHEVMDHVPATEEARTEIPDTSIPSPPGTGDNATPDQNLEMALQHVSAEAEDLDMLVDENSEQSDVEVEESQAPNPEEMVPESTSSPGTGRITQSTANTTSVSDEHEHGESDYEPPEASPPPAEVQSWGDTPVFSSLEATPSAIPASSAHEPREISPLVTKNEAISVDDISGFEQPESNPLGASETSQVVTTVDSQDTDEPNGLDAHKFFTPYESPLKHFRAYRFHPKFNEEVAGGFRSLTYSHKIEQDKMLCRWELAGGICNDSTCDMQHFKELSIPDDAILVHLGDSSAYSESDKANFIRGLREVLQDLRVKKLRDFQTIATEIAAFRSKFLNDSSRVLTLDTPAL